MISSGAFATLIVTITLTLGFSPVNCQRSQKHEIPVPDQTSVSSLTSSITENIQSNDNTETPFESIEEEIITTTFSSKDLQEQIQDEDSVSKTEIPKTETKSGGLLEVILNEICDEDTEKLTRKEKILCAALKDSKNSANSEKDRKGAETMSPDNKGATKDDNDEDEEHTFYLPKGYNKQAAPVITKTVTHENGSVSTLQFPVPCSTYLNIRSIKDIDETKEEVTLDMDLIVVWLDGYISSHLLRKNITPDFSKLEQNLKPISAVFLDKIWLPDLFFEEVVAVARPVVLDKGGIIVLFNRNMGGLFIRSKMLITLQCGMNFKHYPADTQKCDFHIRSAAHGRSDVKLQWVNRNNIGNNKSRQPVDGAYLHETSDPNFDYQIASVESYNMAPNLGPETRAARESSYLWFEIRFRRKMSYHLLQTYLPSLFFLVVTWLCFLIPNKMFEARVGVAMTTLLTQTSMFSSIRESTPVVGYVKAIDTWMVTCIAFIFLALCAFTSGAWIRMAKKKTLEDKENMENNGTIKETEVTNLHRKLRIYGFLSTILEKYTALLLSLSFLLFAVLYWSWLLSESEHLNWNVNETLNSVE